MSDRAMPILFNAEMVRAVLNGTKAQTRRPAKAPKGSRLVPMVSGGVTTLCSVKQGGGPWASAVGVKCPFGVPGDRLWVRERARVVGDGYVDGGKVVRLRYEADLACTDWMPYPARLKPPKPSRCIPNGCFREASRITLEVTGVRVERVQDISVDDARAEGFEAVEQFVGCFRDTWDNIYVPRGTGWDANPWVWVADFKMAVTP